MMPASLQASLKALPSDAFAKGLRLACVRRIAEAVSTVPTKVYRKPRGGQREEAYDHPLYELLGDEPNEWQDPLQFRETLAVHCAVTNNAYAFKNVVRGKLVELIPDHPDACPAEMERRPHAVLPGHRSRRLIGDIHAGRDPAHPRPASPIGASD
jgi:portal protein